MRLITKYSFTMLLLSLFSSVMLGCNAEEEGATQADEQSYQTGGEIRVAYPAQPPLFDPHESVQAATADITRHVFEPLLTVASDYSIKPMLAESYTQSEDGKEITFQLREGILFHNGKEMTSEDVVASMEKWVESVGSRGNFTGTTFEAIDDYTVQMVLPEPSSTALAQISYNGNGFPAIMPKKTIDQTDGEMGVQEYIGTGPFQFEEWQIDQYIHLSKFDDYQPLDSPADGLAGARVALVDDLYFEFVTDPSTRISGIQTGEYDIIHQVPIDNVEQLETAPNVQTYIYPGGSIAAHLNKSSGFFTDKEARQKFASALDMESIMMAGFTNEEFYDLNHQMMMYNQELWQSDVGADKYNQSNSEEMIQYLEEINYDGEELTILTTRDYDYAYNASVVVEQQLEDMGVNVNLVVYDWPTLVDTRNDPEAYDLFISGSTQPPEPTTSNFFSPEWPGWAEIPDELYEFREMPSLEESVAIYDKLHEWYWDYVPIVKFGDYNAVDATRTSIENFQKQHGFMLWNTANNGE